MAREGDKPGVDAKGFSLLENGELSLQRAMIAHELKEPLATIRQLALELSATNPETMLIAEQIRVISERSLRLSSNLAKSQRLQAMLFATEPISVFQLCSDVAEEIAPLYRARGRKFHMASKRSWPLAIANYDLLRRIVLNFADNALEYSDESGVVELFSQLKRTKGVVRVGVRDYGPALPTKVWRSLRDDTFEPGMTHTRPNSSGLGLLIASRFAEVSNAQIGALRHRDGASFYVDVPISRQLSLL